MGRSEGGSLKEKGKRNARQAAEGFGRTAEQNAVQATRGPMSS